MIRLMLFGLYCIASLGLIGKHMLQPKVMTIQMINYANKAQEIQTYNPTETAIMYGIPGFLFVRYMIFRPENMKEIRITITAKHNPNVFHAEYRFGPF
jgi:uncharacterized membrane protein